MSAAFRYRGKRVGTDLAASDGGRELSLPMWIDSLLALVLALLFPLYVWRAYGRFRTAVQHRGSAARIRKYGITIAIQWSLVVVTLFVWFLPGRSAAALGLKIAPGVPFWIGLGVTSAALVFLIRHWVAIRALDAEGRGKLRTQLDSVRDLLPRTGREYRIFQLLAITAGVCEEILYRGFLIAYLAALMGEWPAVLLAGSIFGAAHFYQGIAGCVKTGVIGILTGVLYLLSESLLWPIVIHAAVDLHGGAVGRLLLRTSPNESEIS